MPRRLFRTSTKANKGHADVPVPEGGQAANPGDAVVNVAAEPDEKVKPSWVKLFAFTRWTHAWPLAAALVATALASGLKTVLAVVLGETFDVTAKYGVGARTASEAVAEISRWSIILVGLGFANWLANTAFLALWILFGELQANSVRLDVFRTLLKRDMAWFDSQEQGISSLLIRIQTQTRELQLATSQVLGLLISDMMTSLASLALALIYSWKLTLVLLATLPISTAVLSLASRRLQPAIQAQKRDLATASQQANASITAIDLVKIFNGYDKECTQYAWAADRAAEHYLVQAQCNSIQIGYVAFWVVSMFVIGFTYGVVLVNDGMEPGYVVTTFYATLASFQGIEAFVPHWLVIAKGIAAGSFLSDLTSDTRGGKSIKKMDGGVRPEQCVGAVKLDNVSFAYPSNPTKKVLDQSSFHFPAGEMTFIVGRSGSGKSTLGNIITDFYKPSTGDVEIDGQSLRTLDKDWVRANITLIQQSSVLFSDTFFNNVAFGHKNPQQATKGEVMIACEAALLQSTLAGLPQGLDTVIGTGGHNLSGGQKQRLALARARLRDPKVLILDEVTSGLDQVSRALVMDAVREWRRGKTTIIITHDVSQINDDDFVYVLDNALLIQKGLKGDLIERASGPFAALATLIADGPEESVAADDPDSPLTSTTSPTVEIAASRFSRMSQLFFGEMENAAMRRNGPGFPQGTSLGISTAHAMKLREEKYWEAPACPASPEDLDSEDDEGWEHGKGRFSRYVEGRFSTSARYSSVDYGNDFASRLALDNPLSPIASEGSRGSLEEPEFIFGDAHRRENITGLRLARLKQPTAESPDEDPTENLTKKPKKAGSLFTTLGTVWPVLGFNDRVVFATGLAICLFGSAATPSFSYCFGQLLGAMWAPGDKMAAGKTWSISLAGIAVADGFCSGMGRYLLERTAQTWVNAVRMEALERILRQPKPWFDKSKNSPGRINECLDRNAEEMRNIVGRFIHIIIYVLGMIGISVVWALAISWNLTLVVLAPLPLLIVAVKGYTMLSGKWETRCDKGAEDASATLTEILLNIRVVRALTLEGYFSNKYYRAVAKTLGLGLRRAGYTSPPFGLYQSLSYPLTSLVFYYGVLLMTKGEVSATQMLQVMNLLLFSMGTSAQILSTIPQLTMAQATAVQMLEYANLPRQPPGGPQGAQKPSGLLPVRMTDLKFSYSRRYEEQALRGVSLDIQPGQCTAIVGHSGCGKSTIVSLLLGLYAPAHPPEQTEASPLTFGGVSYAEIDVQYLRSAMAYVSQSPFLFPATIAENITYGLSDGSHYRQSQCICRAADAAGIHDFIISLPQGYNTVVGDGGQALSGGQAQRLSIARALVRQPQILVLDEPTSALDTESAAIIRRTVKELTRGSGSTYSGMAIVLVTHSREMMRAADRIVVLEEGSKVEEGTYDGLLAERGAFAHLLSGGEWEGEEVDTKKPEPRARPGERGLHEGEGSRGEKGKAT